MEVLPGSPSRRVDLPRLLAEVNAATGAGLRLLGASEHGESGGAGFVEWPDGRDAVVTRSPLDLAAARLTADVLAAGQAQGLPVPRHDLIVALGDGGVAVVQQRLAGRPSSWVDAGVVEAMVDTNDRFAGVLADRPDVAIPALYLRHSAPVAPRHQVLHAYSARARRLLSRIRAVGAGVGVEMTATIWCTPTTPAATCCSTAPATSAEWSTGTSG